jgi:hypothetical protein
MYKRLSITLLAGALCGCTAVSPIDTSMGDADFSKVGLDIEWGDESPVEKEEKEKENDDSSIEAVEELRQSYDAAVNVRDILIDVSKAMNTETRESLAPALDAFSNDIEALKYYVDTATYDELTAEEHSVLLILTADIEHAMTVFGDILAALL